MNKPLISDNAQGEAMKHTGVRALLLSVMVMSAIACTNPGVAISNRAMDAHDTAAYNEYLKTAAEINLEREKAGLPPAPIMSRAEWAGTIATKRQ